MALLYNPKDRRFFRIHLNNAVSQPLTPEFRFVDQGCLEFRGRRCGATDEFAVETPTPWQPREPG